MGLLTFAEMKSQVRSMLGGRTDQDALIMRGLQFAQHRIAKTFHFEELFVDATETVSNTGTGNELTDAQFDLPSTIRKLHSITLVETTRTIPLYGVSADAWESTIGATEVYSRGEPSHFVVHFDRVTLWKVPDATYTLRLLYSIWPTEIVLNAEGTAPSDTSAKSLLDHKDELIIMYAAVWVNLALGAHDKANYFFSIYKDMLGEAGAFDVLQPASNPVAASNRSPIIADHTVPTFSRSRR